MDCTKIGQLILYLRTEKKMTQKQLADAMNISDRTISKWERGLGCPDVSLLNELSGILGVNIEKILSGYLESNDTNGGNMRKIKFYVCPICSNILFGIGEAEISCCGRILTSLNVNLGDNIHIINIDEVDGDYFVTVNHEMSKEHFISFAAYVAYDRVLLIKLYPEQNAEFRIQGISKDNLYVYCNKHGLYKYSVNAILKTKLK